jgi:hypothetical protein
MFNSQSEFKNSTKIAYDDLKSNTSMKLNAFRALLVGSTPFNTVAAYMAHLNAEDPLKSLSGPKTQDELSLSDLVNLFYYNNLTIVSDNENDRIQVVIKDTYIDISYQYHARSGELKKVQHTLELSQLKEYKLDKGVFTFIDDVDIEVKIGFTTKDFLYSGKDIKKVQVHNSFLQLKCVDIANGHIIEDFIYIDNKDGFALRRAGDRFETYMHVLTGFAKEDRGHNDKMDRDKVKAIIATGQHTYDGRTITLTEIK